MPGLNVLTCDCFSLFLVVACFFSFCYAFARSVLFFSLVLSRCFSCFLCLLSWCFAFPYPVIFFLSFYSTVSRFVSKFSLFFFFSLSFIHFLCFVFSRSVFLSFLSALLSQFVLLSLLQNLYHYRLPPLLINLLILLSVSAYSRCYFPIKFFIVFTKLAFRSARGLWRGKSAEVEFNVSGTRKDNFLNNNKNKQKGTRCGGWDEKTQTLVFIGV